MKVNPLPLKATDLEVGMVYYECSSGMNLQGTVVSPVVESAIFTMGKERKQWCWVAERKNGTKFDCAITEGFEHYGPRIYREPQYGSYNHETKQLDYKVI